MVPQTIPPRIRWAVDVLDPQPGDQVLEIGCGPGYAAELICERLEKGRLLAIDRSESGVDRTKRRCADAIAAGKLTVRHIDLATLRVPIKRLDRAFAFNVNLFWVRDCEAEVALLHERISPGGALYLFYEVTSVVDVPVIVEKASAALVKAGFRVAVVESKKPAVIGLVGRR
jgi:trans-aconitate methyltransferase